MDSITARNEAANYLRGRSYAGRSVMLDGRPAIVSGRLEPFAVIRRLDGRGGAVEVAWGTVAYVIESRFADFRS